ncbi:hypothetical protein Tco_0768994 [Tanacetum coccineum]|uniref:Integrase, catalytic region, zinc finger, CCHC-type, peptidase aspartic, catalytic n=1 Tax=Tanacetum coccineum TaxID=301880 RepID=A0ABQ4ZBS7_9ASTR
MYKIKIVDKQEVHTQANKSVLTSTRLKGVSSVRRPSTRSSSSKNSVLSNTKNQTEVVEVSPRTNKKRKVTSQIHVVKNKYYVATVDVKNALKAKIDVSCVSCKKNMLTPCRDKCLAKYKWYVHSNVRRALFTTPKAAKTKSIDTTPVVEITRFTVVTPLSAKNKVIQIVFWIVDSLGHNLFSVGQLCDGDLEVAFRLKACYVRNLEGDDLLTGARDSNLYTISILDMAASSPVCLMSKATSTKSWLWH